MKKINQIEIVKDGVIETRDISLTDDEAKNVVDKQLITKSAVPNSGYVDKVYFNTSLSVEEVNNVINNANLYWLDFGDFKAYYVCSNSTSAKAIAIMNLNGIYFIQVMMENDLNPIFNAETDGWQSDVLSTYNPYVINDSLINEMQGVSIGSQNDLIKDLVYVQSEKYATVEKVESYLFTEESPTKVPNTGTIEKLYFNTNLSEEEVTNYINDANLNFIKIGDRTVYLFAIDTEALNGIGIFKLGENKYAINQANFTTLSTENILFHTSELTNSQNVQGWESELKNNNGLYKVTFNTASNYQNMPIGQQNELLKDLISMTPFGKQEKYVSKDYLDEYMKNNFENGNEGSY